MKIQIILILLLTNSLVFAQKSNPSKEVAVPPQDKDILVYRNSLILSDFEVATNSLHQIIVNHPNGSIYKDTLALVYLQRNKFVQASVIAQSLYKEKENDFRLEILAICAKQLSKPNEAIDFYKKLYANTKKIEYAFEQLGLEYSFKRLAEAKFTAENLLINIPEGTKIELTVEKTENKTKQKISLKAGVYYLLGKIHTDLNSNKSALEAFQNALKINPDYELAVNAYKELLKKK